MIEFLRFLAFVVCLITFVSLWIGFVRYRDLWNRKTRDYWYGRMMWSVAGMGISAEDHFRHTPFRYNIIFILAASISTLIGIARKGSWGSDVDSIKDNAK